MYSIRNGFITVQHVFLHLETLLECDVGDLRHGAAAMAFNLLTFGDLMNIPDRLQQRVQNYILQHKIILNGCIDHPAPGTPEFAQQARENHKQEQALEQIKGYRLLHSDIAAP